MAFEDHDATADEPTESGDLTAIAVVDEDLWQPIVGDGDQQVADPGADVEWDQVDERGADGTFDIDPTVETFETQPPADTFEIEPSAETFMAEPLVETFETEAVVETFEPEAVVEAEEAAAAPLEPTEPDPIDPEAIEPEAEAADPELDEIERRAAALLAAVGALPKSPADDQPIGDEDDPQPEMADPAEEPQAEPEEPPIAADPEPVWQPPAPIMQPDPDQPVVAPEPAAVWQPPTPLPQPEPEAAFDQAPEPQPTAETPAEGSPASAAEPDEIEQRAAALLARMEAKRAELDASEPDADPTDVPEPAIEEPAYAAATDEPTVVVGHLEPNYLEPAETTETTPNLTDVAVEDDSSVAPAEPSPESTDYGIAESESPWGDQRLDESLPEVPPLGENAPTAGDAAEGFGDATAPPPHRAAARKLALPPWQLPGAAASVEYERFGPDESVSDDRSLFSGRFERAAAEDVVQPPLTSESVSGDQDQNLTDAPPIPAPQMRPGPPLPAGWPPRLPSGRPLPPPPPGWRPPPPPPGWVAGQAPAPQATPQQAAPQQPAPQPAAPVEPAPRHAAPPNFRQPQAFRVPPPLDDAELADPRLNAPQIGWRRTVHKATGGHVNLGPSRRERLRKEIQEQIRQPIVGDFRIAVLSIKGGVGKTTTTLGLGSALAMVRHDRVIAVDANPDRGTLAERVRDVSTRSTVRDLLSDPNIHSYADVRNHTLMASSRLEVLASEQEPAVSEVFGDADYRQTIDILRHYYNIILTDCGTGIMHSAMTGILDLAHAIVLVSAPAMDAARSASATLDWLMQHGHSGLVRDAHVVFSASRPGSANLKIDKLYEHFETRCRSVHMIPFDPHLSEGADVDFGLLNQATMDAYLDLAASVSEDFGRLRGAARS
ncbi:MAG: AAA family ATPase [Mycolicibacterium sp.]|nr:AAA family ATPase [Mycolicibacterium sp.]